MNTQKKIEAEIKDGRLIIKDKFEIEVNIEGILELFSFADPKDFAENISDLFCSYAKLCAFMPAIPESELEQFSLVMPGIEPIFYLEVLSRSLKKMQP